MKRQTGGAGGVDGEVLQVDYVKKRWRTRKSAGGQEDAANLCEPHVNTG